jgi:hypothetical protein
MRDLRAVDERLRVLYVNYDGGAVRLGRPQVVAYLRRLARCRIGPLVAIEKIRLFMALRAAWPRRRRRRLLFEIGGWVDGRMISGAWAADGLLYRFGRRCERWCYAEANTVVTPTTASAERQLGETPADDACEPPPVPRRRFGPQARKAELRVLLVTESTYPFHFGGVSTWCRNLITGLPAVDFHILALVAKPDLAPLFVLPTNVSALTTVPIWGVRDALETREPLRLADLRRRHRTPDRQALVDGLARPLRELVEALFSDSADPFALADNVNALHEFFLAHDFDSSMRSGAAWDAFAAGAQTTFPAAARAAGYGDVSISISDVLTGLHWLCHWLLPLSRPLPEVDVAHATMAGECILPAVAAKLHQGAGLVFSEHGVYVREVYLREAANEGRLFLKLLKIGFAVRTSEMAYAVSDEISTCCDYNKRWAFGSRASRVQTIHYGLDPIAATSSLPSPSAGWLGFGCASPLALTGALLGGL